MEPASSESTTSLLENGRRHGEVFTNYLRKGVIKVCSVSAWRRRFPITIWLPRYKIGLLLQDIIAGITVGLTSIPQGIAYAIIAGLPPQYGLYSSLFPGVIYMVFGSCKDVTVGPTAILALLVSKYVAYSIDFAILASFLSGCIILLLGLLNLGFLLDFISKPVISAFTAAAALQIASSQLKSLFRITGSSSSTFLEAIENFIRHIKTCQLWDPILGFSTMLALLLMKKIPIPSEEATSSRWSKVLFHSAQSGVRARNAIVVAIGAVLAYCLHKYNNIEPFALTGKIVGGLPQFGPPPFSTVVANQTYHFQDMLGVFGAQGLVLPLVAVLESVAIAKAFAADGRVDASQEMVALGMCNALGAICRSMPVTGSFTRTALNHASGVATPAGGLFKGVLVLLALTQLTAGFQYIPRATLAGVIVVAMCSLIHLATVPRLWTNSKLELCVYLLTFLTGLTAGLEFGILAGVLGDLARVLYRAARPTLQLETFKVGNHNCIAVVPVGSLSYCSAEYVVDRIQLWADGQRSVVVLDGRHLQAIDIGVVENLITVILQLEKKDYHLLMWKFPQRLRTIFENLEPRLSGHFINTPSVDEFILSLNPVELIRN